MPRLAGIRMLQREIDAALEAGHSVERIDAEIIAPCRLSAHARCALWVYAHNGLPTPGTPRRGAASE
ncbi:MAG: hypothetical protein QOE13_3547 [Gaiellaceae bacterium]|nr:hypothetical protein [Gaiellaceae bacterium]